MLIDRAALVRHLSLISCKGVLPDVVLKSQFAGAGVSLDQQVLVVAGPMEKIEPLPGETGVTNLALLIQVLKSMEDDQISLTVEDNKIVVAAHDRNFRLVTSAPRVIGTKIDPEILGKMLALLPPDAAWYNLEHRFVDGVLKAYQILKAHAEVWTLNVGPKGAQLAVGNPQLNVADFDLPNLRSETEYSLFLGADAMVPVLEQLTDFTRAQMVLTGPNSVVAVREGAYTYIVSPNKGPGADKK